MSRYEFAAGDEMTAAKLNKNIIGGSYNAGETINGATLPVPVYQDTSDNEFYACDANDTAKLNFVGFAISDGNPIDIQMNGIVKGFSGLDEGEKYYVQDTAGTIGKTPGTHKIYVGRAISQTELLIEKIDETDGIGYDGSWYTYQLPYAAVYGNEAGHWQAISVGSVDATKRIAYMSFAVSHYAYTRILGSNYGRFQFNVDSGKLQIPAIIQHPNSGYFQPLGLTTSETGIMDEDQDAIWFEVDYPGNLYAKSSAGDGTEESTQITGITLSNLNIYEIRWIGNVAKFYVNGILKATHSTKVPDSSSPVLVAIRSAASGGYMHTGIPTLSVKI